VAELAPPPISAEFPVNVQFVNVPKHAPPPEPEEEVELVTGVQLLSVEEYAPPPESYPLLPARLQLFNKDP
jgi:hypothetical protein